MFNTISIESFIYRVYKAVIADYIGFTYYLSQDRSCMLRVVKDPMFQSGISFGVRRGLSWKILIDQVILNLHEQEIITELRSKWFSEICQPQFFVTTKTPLTVVWFSGLVFVLVMSIFATLVMLIPENWYFRYFRQVVFRFYFKYVLQTKRYSVSKDCDEKSPEMYDSYNL